MITAEVLTLVMALFFFVGGLFQIVDSAVLGFSGWGWHLIDGLITIVLGLMILAQWPASGLWVIGLFVGIDLIFYGLAWIAIARTAPIGVSDWMAVDQERINEFADCTGDRQWIHVDVERARRESPFGGPVAHGYLTLSLVGPLSLDVGVLPSDAAAGFNYDLDKVRFLAPVPAGGRVRLRVVLDNVEERSDGQLLVKTKKTIEIENSDKPALIAEALALALSK
jgi:acyl dehydratase